MEIGEVYFWTATIYEWKKLLKPDPYKEILVNSLTYLHKNNLINVYGFSIMPNHIHLLWEMLSANGRELPNASFTKFTAHELQKDLEKKHPHILDQFFVNDNDRSYNIWKKKPKAIRIINREMLEQKLDYIHNNPLQGHWNLAQCPEDYLYSSARFYLNGDNRFPFLTHYLDRF